MYVRDPDLNVWWLFVYEYEYVEDSEDEASDTDNDSETDIATDSEISDNEYISGFSSWLVLVPVLFLCLNWLVSNLKLFDQNNK